MSTKIAAADDFIIWGPSVSSGLVALNAVHALYFLPQRYKLVLPTAKPEEKSQYNKILSAIRRTGLDGRVQFSDKPRNAKKQAVVVIDETPSYPAHVSGKSPEALASAILRATR